MCITGRYIDWFKDEQYIIVKHACQTTGRISIPVLLKQRQCMINLDLKSEGTALKAATHISIFHADIAAHPLCLAISFEN